MNFFNFSCWITLFWYLCICLILHLYVYFFEFWCWICVICSPTTTFGLQLCWFLALFTFKRRHVTRKRFNKVKQQSERKIFQYIFTNHACKEDEKWQFMPDKHDQYDWITFVADLYLYSFPTWEEFSHQSVPMKCLVRHENRLAYDCPWIVHCDRTSTCMCIIQKWILIDLLIDWGGFDKRYNDNEKWPKKRKE